MSRKPPFTIEQQAVVDCLITCLRTFSEMQAHFAAQRVLTYVDGLSRALVEAGVVTPEAIKAAVAEIEAGRAVEEALDPERQAALAEIQRLMQDMRQVAGQPFHPNTKKQLKRGRRAPRRRR